MDAILPVYMECHFRLNFNFILSYYVLVRFLFYVTITTKVVCSNPVLGEMYSIQYYVKQFVSDLRHVGGFLRALRFPPPIKLNATI